MTTHGDSGESDHRIADLKARHPRCRPHRSLRPRRFRECPFANRRIRGRGPAEPRSHGTGSRCASANRRRHRRRDDTETPFSRSGGRGGDVAELDHLRGTVTGDEGGFHGRGVEEGVRRARLPESLSELAGAHKMDAVRKGQRRTHYVGVTQIAVCRLPP